MQETMLIMVEIMVKIMEMQLMAQQFMHDSQRLQLDKLYKELLLELISKIQLTVSMLTMMVMILS